MKQNQNGGTRPGAGRKLGSATRKTREIADRAADEGITPLEYLIEQMRKPYPDGADALVKATLDALRMDAAKAAAPYIHPRLSQVDSPIELELMGELADQGKAVIGAISTGHITPAQGATLMQTIAAQARIVEVDQLEKRVAALEAKRQEGNRL